MTSPSNRCLWCLKRPLGKPQWEQRNIRTGEYVPMCARCARRRLRNPLNALLDMRRIS